MSDKMVSQNRHNLYSHGVYNLVGESILIKVLSVSHSIVTTLWDLMDCSPPGSSVHGILQAKNTGVGSHAFLQGIFLAQELNLGLLHCRQILCPLSHQGSAITS